MNAAVLCGECNPNITAERLVAMKRQPHNHQAKEKNEPTKPLLKSPARKSRRVLGRDSASLDSVIAIFKDRLTYTFIDQNEVGSIHFDRRRGEIFYTGHNIANLDLNPGQKMLLGGMKAVIENDEKAREFLPDYCATLARYLDDNK